MLIERLKTDDSEGLIEKIYKNKERRVIGQPINCAGDESSICDDF